MSRTVFAVEVSGRLANVSLVHLNTNACLVGQRIPNFVYVANAWRHRFNIAGQHVDLKTCGHPSAVRHFAERLARLAATQNAAQPPNRMVVDGCALTGSRHQTHHTEAAGRICVNQIELRVVRMCLRQFRVQPIVMCQQWHHELLRLRQKLVFSG